MAKHWMMTGLLLIAVLIIGCEIGDRSGLDKDIDGDADAKETEAEDTGLQTVVLKGGSTTGGNAIPVYLGFSTYNAPEGFEWKQISLDVNSVFLPRSPECDSQKGERLDVETVTVSLSILGETDVRLMMMIPPDQDYCAMRFDLPAEKASFRAQGTTPDNRSIVIESDLDGLLPFLPSGEIFRWSGNSEHYWVAALDLAEMLPAAAAGSLSGGQGDILINEDTTPELMDQLDAAIVRSFRIFKDYNSDGEASSAERSEANTVAYGDAPPEADMNECLEACGDGCYLPEHKLCGEDGRLWCPCEMACYGIEEAEDPDICACADCEDFPGHYCLDDELSSLGPNCQSAEGVEVTVTADPGSDCGFTITVTWPELIAETDSFTQQVDGCDLDLLTPLIAVLGTCTPSWDSVTETIRVECTGAQTCLYVASKSACETNACEGMPDGSACEDGNACTVNDQCTGGECAGAPIDCDDGDPCTTDSCDPVGGCQHIPTGGEGCEAVCEGCEGFAGEYCFDPAASSGPECNDLGFPQLAITADEGDPCAFTLTMTILDDEGEEQSQSVPMQGCNITPIITLIMASSCTSEWDAGAGTISVDCPDYLDCYLVLSKNSCGPVADCQGMPDGMPCSDDNPCTFDEVCQAGICLSLSEPLDCDDDNPCTDDMCDESGGCLHVPNGDPGCGENSCDGLPEGTLCDDGDPCTTGDTCQSSGMCIGLPVNCDDGDPCTDDLCDNSGTCLHLPNDCD